MLQMITVRLLLSKQLIALKWVHAQNPGSSLVSLQKPVLSSESDQHLGSIQDGLCATEGASVPGPSRCKDFEPLEQEGTNEYGKSNISRMISRFTSCSCHDVNDTA